jgi:Flp pilus assembly protein TadG
MRRRIAPLRPARRARGQVAVEFALSIVLVLTLLVGFFDLARGLAVQAAVSEMAWAAARFAASGACLSSPRDEQTAASLGEVSGGTGPTCPGGTTGTGLSTSDSAGAPVTVSPAQQDAIAAQARAAAFVIDAGAATVVVTLPDGGARLGQRVRVQVTYAYIPVASQFVGGRAVIPLSSSQTLLIAR